MGRVRRCILPLVVGVIGVVSGPAVAPRCRLRLRSRRARAAGACVRAPPRAAASPAPSRAAPPPPRRSAGREARGEAPPRSPAPRSPPRGASAPSAKSASSASAKATTRAPDTSVRRAVAGGPTLDDTSVGADTPELRALHAAERELFPPASPALGAPWPQELPFPVATTDDRPRVHASGLSPVPPASSPASGRRRQGHVVALEARHARSADPLGRARRQVPRVLQGRSARSLDAHDVAASLGPLPRVDPQGVPQEGPPRGPHVARDDRERLRAHRALAASARMGLWQFMPDTGKIYGLSQDRWVDQRMSFAAATEAAADFLADLHRRFGSWDLAMAGYNMGYGGVLSAVRRYNTNDYWALAKLEGSFPWETTLYVPKILAAAIVAQNLAAFGYQDVDVEPPLEGEDVPVGPGIALATVAQACGVTTKEVEQLNPELRASRTPPRAGGLGGEGARRQGERLHAEPREGASASSRRWSGTSFASARRSSRSRRRVACRSRSSSSSTPSRPARSCAAAPCCSSRRTRRSPTSRRVDPKITLVIPDGVRPPTSPSSSCRRTCSSIRIAAACSIACRSATRSATSARRSRSRPTSSAAGTTSTRRRASSRE